MTQLTPRRSLTLLEPTFTATVKLQGIYVVAVGKLTSIQAGTTLQSFVRAFLEGGLTSQVKLDYGLSSFTANLVEIRTEER